MDLSRFAPLLEFRDVGRTYVDHDFRRVAALEQVTFDVRPGEFVSVIGPSGCGKTTILRIAAGLEYPTSGTVRFEGEPISGPGRDRGLVFQSYNAFPWLNVRQNVAFGLTNRLRPADELVDKWLLEMGLSDFATVYPKALSGGMRQRLAIARAMIVEPKLLLLDEPFGALDDRTRLSMQELLLAVAARSRCTILLVTHDIREAILLSNRIVIISPRPGCVKEIVESTLPMPRSREGLKTREFERLYEYIADQWQTGQPTGSNTASEAEGGGK